MPLWLERGDEFHACGPPDIAIVMVALQEQAFVLGNCIKNLIEKFNLSDSISLIGSKFGNELEEYYKNSNYFLQLSSYEGMPHSILEAMNHKLIVIASKFGGNYELIGNNDFGYIVESLEVDQVTDSIKNAINDSQNQIIASKGKNLVNQEYNIELTTQKYAEVIFKNE